MRRRDARRTNRTMMLSIMALGAAIILIVALFMSLAGVKIL